MLRPRDRCPLVLLDGSKSSPALKSSHLKRKKDVKLAGLPFPNSKLGNRPLSRGMGKNATVRNKGVTVRVRREFTRGPSKRPVREEEACSLPLKLLQNWGSYRAMPTAAVEGQGAKNATLSLQLCCDHCLNFIE